MQIIPGPSNCYEHNGMMFYCGSSEEEMEEEELYFEEVNFFCNSFRYCKDVSGKRKQHSLLQDSLAFLEPSEVSRLQRYRDLKENFAGNSSFLEFAHIRYSFPTKYSSPSLHWIPLLNMTNQNLNTRQPILFQIHLLFELLRVCSHRGLHSSHSQSLEHPSLTHCTY